MEDRTVETGLEARSRVLLHDSVEALDMRVRSRLTQARHAALSGAARKRWHLQVRFWTPAAGVAAAALLGATLWFGLPFGNPAQMSVEQPSLEDLEMVASSDESEDSIEMLQNDLDFYDFADKAASEPSA